MHKYWDAPNTELRSIVADWKAGEAWEAGEEKVSSLKATSYKSPLRQAQGIANFGGH